MKNLIVLSLLLILCIISTCIKQEPVQKSKIIRKENSIDEGLKISLIPIKKEVFHNFFQETLCFLLPPIASLYPTIKEGTTKQGNHDNCFGALAHIEIDTIYPIQKPRFVEGGHVDGVLNMPLDESKYQDRNKQLLFQDSLFWGNSLYSNIIKEKAAPYGVQPFIVDKNSN